MPLKGFDDGAVAGENTGVVVVDIAPVGKGCCAWENGGFVVAAAGVGVVNVPNDGA